MKTITQPPRSPTPMQHFSVFSKSDTVRWTFQNSRVSVLVLPLLTSATFEAQRMICKESERWKFFGKFQNALLGGILRLPASNSCVFNTVFKSYFPRKQQLNTGLNFPNIFVSRNIQVKRIHLTLHGSKYLWVNNRECYTIFLLK